MANEIVKKEVIRDIKMEGEVGDRLLVLYKTGELVELNVRDKTVDDDILVENVMQFDNDDDRVVTSTVRQLVDYVDNDVTFSQMANASANTSWSASTVKELKPYIDPNI